MSYTYEVIQLPPNTNKKKIKSKPKEPFIFNLVRLAFSSLGPVFPRQAAKIAYKLFSTPRMRAQHRKSDSIIEKAKVFDFMYAGRLLKAYEWGSGDKIVLLIHGWESRGTALRSFVPDLVQQGFKVVAIDGPAHGNSYGKQTNLLHFGGAIRAIINQVGEVHSIIAHSFGGASTIFTLANLAPEIKIDRLVLIAVPSALERVVDHYVKFIRLPGAAHKELNNIFEKIIGRSLNEVDVSKASDSVQVSKTLLVHDREDTVVPFAASESIAENWDNISFLITEGYGHYNLIKNPVVVDRVVCFVSN